MPSVTRAVRHASHLAAAGRSTRIRRQRRLAQHRHVAEADTPCSWSHISAARIRRHRRVRHHHGAGMRRQQFRRQIGGECRRRAARDRRRAAARRSQASAAATAAACGRARAAGADEMHARQPVPGDDLRERGLALHQFGQSRRRRIGRHRRIVGDDAARSTTTTRASRASSRASVSAVSVMLSPGAVPSTVILRAASPGSAQVLGQLLDLADQRRLAASTGSADGSSGTDRRGDVGEPGRRRGSRRAAPHEARAARRHQRAARSCAAIRR